jgi:hypothetical protein
MPWLVVVRWMRRSGYERTLQRVFSDRIWEPSGFIRILFIFVGIVLVGAGEDIFTIFLGLTLFLYGLASENIRRMIRGRDE